MQKTDSDSQSKFLNLGCGSTFHPSWRNLDVSPSSEEIQLWNATHGIPFDSSSVDVVYHSHLLEHLEATEGQKFLAECFRVLKARGILRVVVPDLEDICKAYLSVLDRMEKGDASAEFDAEWMRLELYDQTTRRRSGGKMLEYLRSKPVNKSFIIERCGEQVSPILNSPDMTSVNNLTLTPIPIHLKCKLALRNLFSKNWLKEKFIRYILGEEDHHSLQNGRFWASGEGHKHMYDRFSLAKLLREVGFSSVKTVNANESKITGWSEYSLDFTSSGYPRKPDSLYMEAYKPKSPTY